MKKRANRTWEDVRRSQMPEGQRLMLEFCEAVRAGEAPDPETLQFFCERFSDVLLILEKEPWNTSVPKKALGLNAKKRGRKATLRSQAGQFKNAMRIVCMIDEGRDEAEAVKELELKMARKGEPPVTRRTLWNHYHRHRKSARMMLAFQKFSARFEKARAFRLEDGATVCKPCALELDFPIAWISDFLDEPACDNSAHKEKK